MAANDDQDFIEDVGDMIKHFSGLQGMSASNAEALASAVTKTIRNNYQGERVSIKKQPRKDLVARQIRMLFNGRNAKELMERYGISRSTLYRIVGKR
ncbi:Mor transcription activator family protein [uncultured Paraglaciecola sp.]|uniref:Mor transcription activator family protein n=1 Tax=uncultured Paraglaciecola sp. TaxID=1765024 RepID=UPI0026080414|nr:Mor transcription activator family protein [uncultured Paraglaciecola sp.]